MVHKGTNAPSSIHRILRRFIVKRYSLPVIVALTAAAAVLLTAWGPGEGKAETPNQVVVAGDGSNFSNF